MPRSSVRLAIPSTILVFATWLLVGCFYIPTRPRVVLTGTRQDFRILAGSALFPGRTTRGQVLATLGPAPFSTAYGRALGYVLEVHKGTWFVPVCFFYAHPAEYLQFGLRFSFDATGRLERYAVADVAVDQPPVEFIGYHGPLFTGSYGPSAIEVLNRGRPPAEQLQQVRPVANSEN